LSTVEEALQEKDEYVHPEEYDRMRKSEYINLFKYCPSNTM